MPDIICLLTISKFEQKTKTLNFIKIMSKLIYLSRRSRELHQPGVVDGQGMRPARNHPNHCKFWPKDLKTKLNYS